MISIIICSINPSLLKKVSKNITETIGVPFEIIAIDNRINNLGICQVYNNGAAQGKYEFLCFIHEDILFHTPDWGINLLDHFSDKKVGLIGTAGGVVKSKFHSSWWYNLSSKTTQRKNIIQHSKEGSKHEYLNPMNEKTSDVLLIDGVFMACRKEIWEKYPFDEINFPKFHFYDLDFSFSVHQQYKVKVVYDVLIEHFSKGSYNKEWIQSAEQFTKKWRHKLPEYLADLSKNKKDAIESNAIDFFINACTQNKLILRVFKYSIYYFIKEPSFKLFLILFKKNIRLILKEIKPFSL